MSVQFGFPLCGVRAFMNRAVRRMFGPKKEEEAEECARICITMRCIISALRHVLLRLTNQRR
jgi:hypothetical protein